MTQDIPRPVTIAILAMGGEGGGVLADWIVDLAEHNGYCAQATSVPGVAQRTGATIYYVEIFPEAAARAAGKEPVLELAPVPGDVDIVLASELMEAGRAIQRGLVTANKTTLIASTHRVYSLTEKMAMGDGRVDAAKLVDAGAAAAKRFVHADFARIADDRGSVISAALFGALAGTGALPFARAEFEHAVRRGGIGVESSLAAFAAGIVAAQAVLPAPAAVAGLSSPAVGGPLAQRVRRQFPDALHDTLLAGARRLVDYQDAAYAREYLDRLEPILELDRAHGDGSFRLANEAARHLALWLSYEDTIRVADLKTRRARFDRIGREMRAEAGQLLAINEFVHPGVHEIADTLPAALGGWLLGSTRARAFVERRVARGRVVRTSSVRGFLLLYLLAGLRRWRRGTLRYRNEHARIDAWLDQVRATAPLSYALAVEVAECPRLVKGYGETRARGTRNFEALMRSLPALAAVPDAAARLRAMREAALADENWAAPDGGPGTA